MRTVRVLLLLLAAQACDRGERPLQDVERAAIADTLRWRIEAAHDFGAGGDQVTRFMALYPEGRVVSTSGGLITVTRDSLEAAIRSFWEEVGVRMQNPEFEWELTEVDVLARDAAVLTGRYHIPHLNPRGQPHHLVGVWTAVFARRNGEWVIVQEHLTEQAPAPMDP